MVKKENTRKNKHLTADERKEIEECLSKRMMFKAIGKMISKAPTTILYEIFCSLMTITETCKRQGKDLINAFKMLFSGVPLFT